MIDMFPQTIGAEHETAGAERALEQAFNRLRVLWRFGQYGDGEIAHGEARDSICRRRGPSLRLPIPLLLLKARRTRCGTSSDRQTAMGDPNWPRRPSSTILSVANSNVQ